MAEVDIIAVFQVEDYKDLALAKQNIEKMLKPVQHYCSTLFVVLVKTKDLYLPAREIIEDFKSHKYMRGAYFLSTFNTNVSKQLLVMSNMAKRYYYISNGSEAADFELFDLSQMYLDYPHAGAIYSDGGVMIKTSVLTKYYEEAHGKSLESFMKKLENLGYKNYKLKEEYKNA